MFAERVSEPRIVGLVFTKTFYANSQEGQEWTCFSEEIMAQGCSQPPK